MNTFSTAEGIIKCAGISGAMTIVSGSFAAHGLQAYVNGPNDKRTEIFRTGIRYQMWHTLALFISGVWMQ